MSQSQEDIVFTEESFGEKDSSGWYILHVTEDVKQKILGWQKYSQFLESIKGEYTLIINPKLEKLKQIKDDQASIIEWQKIEFSLKKEIAYAQYKIDQSTDVKGKENHLEIATYILTTLQSVQGTYTHEAEYEEEFEEQYAKTLEKSQ